MHLPSSLYIPYPYLKPGYILSVCFFICTGRLSYRFGDVVGLELDCVSYDDDRLPSYTPLAATDRSEVVRVMEMARSADVHKPEFISCRKQQRAPIIIP